MPRNPPKLLRPLKVLDKPPTHHLSKTPKRNPSLPTSISTQSPLRKPHCFPHIPTAPLSRSLQSYSTFPSPKPPFPITPICPPSTCACIPTPTDLNIDYEATLSGTVPAYTQHVLISTGRDDWASRITDDDDSHAALTGILKRELGLGGRFHDVRVCLPLSSELDGLRHGEERRSCCSVMSDYLEQKEAVVRVSYFGHCFYTRIEGV